MGGTHSPLEHGRIPQRVEVGRLAKEVDLDVVATLVIRIPALPHGVTLRD